MAMTLSNLDIAIALRGHMAKNGGGLIDPGVDLPHNATGLSITLTVGAGAGAAAVAYAATHTATLSATTDIDLQALTGQFGETVSFDIIRALFIQTKTIGQGNYLLHVEPGSSNGFDDFINGTNPQIELHGGNVATQPGVLSLIAMNSAGYLVDATNKVLSLNNPNAFNVDVDLIILGE